MTVETGRATTSARFALRLLRDGQPCWGGSVSTSMAPVLEPGDRLYVDPSRRRPRRGDLIAAVHEGAIVVHRVVATAAGGCWTKGDAALALDPFVAAEQVLGTVRIVATPGGRQLRLTAVPWNALQRALGWCGWWATRLCPRLRPPWLARVVWRLLRTPFHIAAAVAR